MSEMDEIQRTRKGSNKKKECQERDAIGPYCQEPRATAGSNCSFPSNHAIESRRRCRSSRGATVIGLRQQGPHYSLDPWQGSATR